MGGSPKVSLHVLSDNGAHDGAGGGWPPARATHLGFETDRAAIERGLRAVVRGEVRFGEHDRMLYATDASLYQVEPIGVVVPADVEDAYAAVKWCGEHGVAMLPRGGGTSLAGQATGRAVVIDMSAWCRGVGEVDLATRTVVAEPGIALDDLNRELARRKCGLFFAPDPATSGQAALGGAIGNNAAGARSIMYGRTSENIAGLEVALSTGERVWLEPGAGKHNAVARRLAEGVIGVVRRHEGLIRERFPKTIRRNAGYGLDLVLQQLDRGATAETIDLSGLLCGSEGTLAATLRARLKLHPTPAAKGLAVIGFRTLEDALAAVPPILQTRPSAVELLDDVVLDAARGNIEYRRYVEMLPGGAGETPVQAVLYVEYCGFGERAEARAGVEEGFSRLRGVVAAIAGVTGADYHLDEAAMLRAWKLRKAGEPLLHGLPGKRKPVTFVEDNAVPVERLAEFVRGFKEIVARHGTRAAYWAHASVGVLHVRPMIDLHDPADRERLRAIAVEVADLARSVGGVMSGEHGDGKVRGPLLERFFGPELVRAFAEVKRIFDPAGLMNPGNIVGAGPIESITRRMRINPERDGISREVVFPHVETYFDYEDQHGFRGAVEMCNGAGVCRKSSGGTMCPSYRATRDERHATRGRGNALRLAISGQIGREGWTNGVPAWDDPGTMQTLHLCLSCKACKSECPSNVDIARLKAEYTAQRYRATGRVPLSARVFGHVRWLNRIGSLTPGLANWFNSTRLAKWGAERVLGVDRRRSIPAFARSLYKAWGRAASSEQDAAMPGGRPRVVVYADCFTAYNEPHIGLAARRVLERLGYDVRLLPEEKWGTGGCCGRALISTGLLEDAIAEADATLEMLRPAIEDESVAAVLVCEPSCLSAMKDDWLQLKLRTPQVLREKLAAKAMLVEEFVGKRWESHPRAAAAEVAKVGPIVLHGHCHQKALWGAETSAVGLRCVSDGVTVLDSGCCGMAGSFGYAKDRYDLSMRIGELSVFPPMRAAGDAVIAAPGTSCRHQIRDGTGREALHPIEVIARAMGV